MKNKEKYVNELMEIIISGKLLAVDKCTNKPKQCCSNDFHCDKCLFYEIGCDSEIRREWLEQEYQEVIKLSDDEIVILKNIDKEYKWIARTDINGHLYVHKNKDNSTATLNVYNHLFQFIKKEPYNIDVLLKWNGVER